MNHKIKYFAITFLLLTAMSCKKSLDSLYQNPDKFTSTSIELLFATGLSNSVPVNATDAYNRNLGSFAPMLQVTANNTGTPASIHLYQFVQSASGSSAGQIDFGRWAYYYNNTMPALKEIEKIYQWQLTPDQQTGYAVYYYLTKIIEAYSTAQATDLFGDMPYSQAFTARNSIYNKPVNLYPKYDSQQSIYDSVLTDLKNAANFLDTAVMRPSLYTAQAILGTQDIMFGGKLSRWNRLANSLRLRYAMRISEANPTRAQQEITDIVQNNRPLILADSNNAYTKNTAQLGNANLFYAIQTLEPAATYAPEYMCGLMNDAADPRLNIFYYTDPSNNGVMTGMPASYGNRDMTSIGFSGKYAYLNPLTFGYNYSMPNGIMIDAADVNFLLAEAAKKGLIPGGDATASQYYNAGIVQSILAYYGFYSTAPATTTVGTGSNTYTFKKVALPAVTATTIQTWLSSSPYAYSSADALSQIAEQKWIHNSILEIDESYAEFRRLGLPQLPADMYNGQQLNATYPLRVPYPSSESANNSSNYNTAAAATNGNSFTVPVWWNK